MTESIKLVLELSSARKTTDYAFDIKNSPSLVLLVLTHKNYPLETDLFQSLNITLEDKETGEIKYDEIFYLEDIEVLGNESIIKLEIPIHLTNKEMTYIVNSISKYNNIVENLPKYTISYYSQDSQEIRAVKRAVELFNLTWIKYVNSIKIDQINQPNGIVGIDSNSKIPKSKFPDKLTNHINSTIYEESPHNLRLNNRYFLEYYDIDSEQWEVADRLNGGEFTIERKDLVFDGGTFTQ